MPEDSTAPPRSGLRRLITPWEYRHLRAFACVRFAGGGFTLGVGLVLLSLGRKAGTDGERRKCYRFATWFLVNAVLQFFGGFLDITADRPVPPR
jgi:low temperature requirement protein LtrA